MSEQWLPISGYEGAYEISSEGRVRSLPRLHPRSRTGKPMSRTGRILKMFTSRSGYLFTTLSKNGKLWSRDIHRLVAETFLTQIEGYEVNHKDGHKQNNRVENLEWVSRSENTLHAHRLGLIKDQSKYLFSCLEIPSDPLTSGQMVKHLAELNIKATATGIHQSAHTGCVHRGLHFIFVSEQGEEQHVDAV